MKSLDLSKLSQDELLAFYGLTFASAAADNHLDKSELSMIFDSLDLSHLDDSRKAVVRDFIHNPPKIEDSLNVLSKSSRELKFAVLVGITEVMLADDVIVEAEMSLMDEVCSFFGISSRQRKAIEDYVQERKRLAAGTNSSDSASRLDAAVAELSSAGIPLGEGIF